MENGERKQGFIVDYKEKMNKILRIGSIIILLTTAVLAARCQYLFMKKPHKIEKIEVTQTADVTADATDFLICDEVEVKCCPICRSNKRMTYKSGLTNEKRDDLIQIDDMDFVVCADCGNVYVIKKEIK